MGKNYSPKIIAAFMFLMTFASCESTYLEDYEHIVGQKAAIEDGLVINGSITSEKKFHEVVLTKPMDFYDEKPDSIEGAKIQLQIGNDTFEYLAAKQHTGIADTLKRHGSYFSREEIQGVPGKAHKLIVEYNGETFTAEDSMQNVKPYDFANMELPISIGEPRFSIPGAESKVFFSSRSNLFGYAASHKYLLYTKDSIESSYNSFFGFATYYIYTHKGIEPQGMLNETSSNFAFGELNDTLWVEKYSISPNYDQYIIAVYKETKWSGDMFSTLPANAPTNVSNGGYGYFYATDVYKTYILVSELKAIIENN